VDAKIAQPQDWHKKTATIKFPSELFINGRFVKAQSGKLFPTINPATGQILAEIAEGDRYDIDLAVKAARQSFDKGVWVRMSISDRKKIMLRWLELMEKNFNDLALLETLDVGKPIRDSLTVDIPLSINCIRWYAETMDKICDEIAPTGHDSVVMVRREPLGVIGAVLPWNFPLLMAAWKIGPILAAGNSLVIKPAEQSPLTTLKIAELAAEAGLPEGVLNVVPGFGETAGQALGKHMDVDCLAFTGSTEVGKYFLRYAGDSNMKRVSLECGGKSPNIVMADAPNLDIAATAAAWGIFYNQGEACSAGSRLLVEEKIKDRFLEKVIAVTKKIKLGDPLDPNTGIGAIIDQKQMQRVLGYIDIGQKEGAKLLCGGKRAIEASGGYFVEPTVFDRVQPNMKIAQEEIFGPVLSVITFKDAEEAVRIANNTIYGLAAAVWTSDITKAFRTTQALRAGTIWVNSYDDGHMAMPFGGFKQSGFGRDKSLHALDKYTDWKSVWVNLKTS
jgi:gamma-glutamyl-gamma-aminobutyraldehyde dehydrogenase/4-guanidinobutyraldehyde dehydrogenase/NAD-dependent aldehyde dehydrogenase